MKTTLTRRSVLGKVGAAVAGLLSAPVAEAAKAAVQQAARSKSLPDNYVPTDHQWVMGIDVNNCIGCGLCAEACKKENKVPDGPYFRTWIERYVIAKPEPESGQIRGKTHIHSANGGIDGGGPLPIPREDVLHAFFVPKLCNLCHHSPCVQVCPVGATFDAPDGAVLVDPNYCIGCGFCIQACPYGCRFMNPATHTAEKCTLCYHRITRELKPACVEVCPSGARVFGDLKQDPPDSPLRQFYANNRVQSLKPHLGTDPRVQYAGLDKEVS